MLVDMGINTVMAREFGPGASALLEQHNVKRVTVKSGVKVAEAIQNVKLCERGGESNETQNMSK